MRILVLSQWYAPEPEFKIHALARELAKRGHQVTSITGYPNYPSGRIYEGYHQRMWSRETMDGVHVIRLPLYPDHSRNTVARSLNYLSFALSATLMGPILSGAIDVMWVYHPPLTVGLPASLIGALRHAPFVYEIQDMWPETLVATAMVRDGLATRVLSGCARLIYSRARAISVISAGFKRNLIAKGVPPEKIHVLPNWANEDAVEAIGDQDSRVDPQLVGKFNVLYAGNLGAAQHLETIIEAASILKDMTEIQFVLAGDGVEAGALRYRVASLGLRNVLFLGRKEPSEMPGVFAQSHVLIAHLRRDPLFEITIPSKVITYLAAGRPIIGALEGDAAEAIREANAGLVCPPENASLIADAVMRLYTMPVSGRMQFGENGRRAYQRHYSRDSLVSRYEELFSQIVEHNRS